MSHARMQMQFSDPRPPLRDMPTLSETDISTLGAQ
jgi:hypothetical protein